MKIDQIRLDCFGKFRGRELTFSEGLNIIYGDNEAGKTTVHTAIKTVFYPLTAKSKDNQEKTCYIPANEKKAEWSLDFTADNGKQYTSYFSMGKTKRGCEQKTIEKSLGTELPEQCVGEAFFRMPEEMFDNLAYMKDKTLTELQNAPLVNRQLSATNQQEQEEPDAIKKINAAITLIERKNNRLDKLEQNRQELLKKRRELKEKETEYQSLKEQMTAIEEMQRRKKKEIDELGHRAEAVEIYSRYEKMKTAESLRKQILEQEEKRTALEEQKQELAYLDDLTQEQISACEELEEEMKEYLTDTQLPVEEIHIGKKERMYRAFSWLSLAVGILCGILILWNPTVFIAATVAAVGLFGFFYYKYRQYKRKLLQCRQSREEERQQKQTAYQQKIDALLGTYRCQDAKELKEKHTFYQELLHQYELTVLSAENARKLFETTMDLTEYEALQAQFAETVPEKQQENLQELRSKKAWAETRLQEYAVTYANLSGKMLNYKGDTELRIRLEEELAATEAETEALTHRLDILKKTRDYMFRAKEAVQTEYLPKVNAEMKKILGEMGLTGMEQIYVDEMMEISVKADEQNFLKSGLQLSMGTRDQLYFALRLAICRLAYAEGESIPLFLDDPFIRLDDERFQHMMKYLNSCKDIQILYFTCHRRALEKSFGGTVIQLS